MSRRGRAGCIVALGADRVAILLTLVDPEQHRRPTSRSSPRASSSASCSCSASKTGQHVPLSFAVMMVLASSFAADEFVVAVCSAPSSSRSSCVRTRERADGSGPGVHRSARRSAPRPCSSIAALRTARQPRDARRRPRRARRRGRCPGAGRHAVPGCREPGLAPRRIAAASRGWPIASSGHADGDRVPRCRRTESEFGIWAPILFFTPLLAAWYAFERLDSATLAYRQTIEALAMAPELGGMVPRRALRAGGGPRGVDG